jgi:hypothetical protein
MNDSLSHSYRVLELKPGAAQDEIKKAYRDLIKVWHPDRFTNDPALQQKAQEKLKEINIAYERLIASVEGKMDSEEAPRNMCAETRRIQVDSFLYYDEYADELTTQSQLPSSELGKTKASDAWVTFMDKFAHETRACT